MTTYELIGIVIGFGILALAAIALTATLNALDNNECGCKNKNKN